MLEQRTNQTFLYHPGLFAVIHYKPKLLPRVAAYCIHKKVRQKERHNFVDIIIPTDWQQATANPATGTDVAGLYYNKLHYIKLHYIRITFYINVKYRYI